MHENLKDAWEVMWADNMPLAMPADAWERALAMLAETFTPEELSHAEQTIKGLRQPGDKDNIDSPLWGACAPCDDEAADLGPITNDILNEMFDAMGVI